MGSMNVNIKYINSTHSPIRYPYLTKDVLKRHTAGPQRQDTEETSHQDLVSNYCENLSLQLLADVDYPNQDLDCVYNAVGKEEDEYEYTFEKETTWTPYNSNLHMHSIKVSGLLELKDS